MRAIHSQRFTWLRVRLNLAGVKKIPRSRTRRHRRFIKRSAEDLKVAEMLRPSEVFRRFGIPASTLRSYMTKLPATERLPFIRIRGPAGRRGILLVARETLVAWINWQSWRFRATPDEMVKQEFSSFQTWLNKRPN